MYIIYFNLYNNPAYLRFYYPPILQVRKPRHIEVKCQVTGSQEQTRVTTGHHSGSLTLDS